MIVVITKNPATCKGKYRVNGKLLTPGVYVEFDLEPAHVEELKRQGAVIFKGEEPIDEGVEERRRAAAASAPKASKPTREKKRRTAE